jgi:predicted Na+-dependent transporter
LFLSGADVVFISNVRGAATAILLLGMIGCGYGAADELYKATTSRPTQVFMALGTTFGVIALGGALVALIFASEVALGVFFVATAVLWLIATTRHFLGIGRPVTGGTTETRKEATTR